MYITSYSGQSNTSNRYKEVHVKVILITMLRVALSLTHFIVNHDAAWKCRRLRTHHKDYTHIYMRVDADIIQRYG